MVADPVFDYNTFRWGGTTFPLTAAVTNSLLKDADPAIYWALLYWTSVLTTHMQERLLAEVALIQGVPITAAVKSTVHFDPGSYLLDHPEIRFPLLAAYRVEGTIVDHTTAWEREDSEWDVAYVLPVLSWQAVEKIDAIFRAVLKIIVNRSHQGFDPAYENGAQVWGTSYANIQSISFKRWRVGRYEDGAGLAYRGLIMRAVVSERVVPDPDDLVLLDGVDTDQSIVDGTTLESVVEFSTDVEPPDPG